MTASSLADHTLVRLTAQLEGYGSTLQSEHRDAIRALLEALEAGLTGTLSPHYHLSAIDPGIGKSLSVSSFLKVWKEQGFKPASSVLIGLSRLTEIDSYIKSAGLDQADVAVLTSDAERNALGVPKEDHVTARVMFTTQQMIERRTRGKSFTEASEFHYQGQPRSLRIWDESLIPAEQLVLRVDDLASLVSALRRRAPEFASSVQALLMATWGRADNDRVLVPEDFAEVPPLVASAKIGELAKIVERLARMAGQQVSVIDKGAGDVHLVGSSPPLPSDFPPVVILDASGRVRSTYSVWEEAGGPLRRLPPAASDYSNLRVHLWERPAGRGSLRAPGAVDDVVSAVISIIAEDPTPCWLIVHYKDHPVGQQLHKCVDDILKPHVHFLTWGMHHGTNDFAHCGKVVLIGQLNYGTLGYRALATACGASIANDTAMVEQELKAGEFRHNMLQALTRGRVRKTRNGLAGACTAYVIASPDVGAPDMVPAVFPGCTVEPWSPTVPKAGGRLGQLMDFLEQALRDSVTRVEKKELIKAIGMKGPNLSPHLKDPRFKTFMAVRGIEMDRSGFWLPPGFDPWDGDGFVWQDLDDD